MRAQDAHRNRQVEAGPLLLQISGRQVDSDMRRRESESGVTNRSTNAVPALAYRRIWQPNGREAILRHLDAGEVDLYINDVRVDAVHCGAQRLEVHSVARLFSLRKGRISSGSPRKAGHKGCRVRPKVTSSGAVLR